MSRQARYPVVCIVDFNHARGPEVEHWIGVENENGISEWPLLPFLALVDGAHSSTEDFSCFTLKHTDDDDTAASLFGISCTRQLDSRELIDRPAEVTRSTVQKAVVVIAESPTVFFGHLKQQLSAVTQAWFAQKNFEDLEIIRVFQETLRSSLESDNDRDQCIGLSLREIIYEFKHQALVLFKCMLLQPKMLFFSLRGERLCMTQFSLLSLMPGLLRNLQDCSDPELNSYESILVKPTSVRTSDRSSLLAFMGLPLQIFGKGSLFGPYTPLQQLDVLADVGTKSYIVGSTNSLLLQQRDRYSDILINLEESTVNITSSSLRTALALSAADRRWIDSLVQSVTESWDELDPSRPKTMGFIGSEDYIRLQFEEYILSMVSAVKYHIFLKKHAGSDLNVFLSDVDGDPSTDFNPDFVEYWQKTDNFRIFQKFTEPEIFDLVPPKHVMAGGLTVEDVQRRLAQQVHELGLDEKVHAGKEVVAKTWATGRNNLSIAFTNISKNVEQYREQRRLQAQQQAAENAVSEKSPVSTQPSSPILGDTQSRAGAYFSSWASWAGEKKKAFARTSTPPPEQLSPKPDVEKPQSSKSSLFGRWSRSSVDLQARDLDAVGSVGSVEPTTEIVWEDDAAKQRVQDMKTAAARRSLPPPPLPPKGVPMDSPEVVAKSMGESESSMVEVTLDDSPSIVEKSESSTVTSARAAPTTTGRQPEETPKTPLGKLEEVPRLDCKTTVVPSEHSPVIQKEPMASAEAGVKGVLAMPSASPVVQKEPVVSAEAEVKGEPAMPPTSSVIQKEPVVSAEAEVREEPTMPPASPAVQKEPVVSAEAEIKREPAIPAAKKVPEPTVETSDMAPSRSPIIRSNLEQKEKQKTRLENREPKKDSVTKRVSQRLQQEPAAGMKLESPKSPTNPTAPPKRNLSNSLAARRAMFEKK